MKHKQLMNSHAPVDDRETVHIGEVLIGLIELFLKNKISA